MADRIDSVDMKVILQEVTGQQIVGSRRIAAMEHQQRLLRKIACFYQVSFSKGRIHIDILIRHSQPLQLFVIQCQYLLFPCFTVVYGLHPFLTFSFR